MNLPTHRTSPTKTGLTLNRRQSLHRLSALGLAAAIPFRIHPAAADQPPEDSKAAETIVSSFFQSILSRNTLAIDPGELDFYLDVDFRDVFNAFTYPPVPSGYSGLDGYRNLAASFQDMRFFVDSVVAAPSAVTTYTIFEGTFTSGDFFGLPSAGQSVSIAGLDYFTLIGDRIYQHWGYYDVFSLLDQIQQT